MLKLCLAVQITKILGHAMPNEHLSLVPDSRSVPAMLEDSGKDVLKRFIQRVTTDVAQNNPIYAYLLGKSDAKYISILQAVWIMSRIFLAFLNDSYVPTRTTNPIFARMAMSAYSALGS